MDDMDQVHGALSTPSGAAAPPTADAGAQAAAPAAAAPAQEAAASPSYRAPEQALDPSKFAATPEGEPGTEEHRGNFGGKMLHGILGALGGTNDVTYERDPQTGKMIATAVKSGPGQQWKRIIAGGLIGAAAGAGVKPGPGSKGRAAGAGFSAGAGMVQQIDERKYGRANEDYDIQQRTTVAKAQIALLNQTISEHSFDLGRKKVLAKFQDSDRENEFATAVKTGGQGSVDLGTASSIDDVIQMHKDMPNLLKEQANGNIIGTPHINEDGQIDGMHYALVTPEWKNSKLENDRSFYKLVPPSKPGEQPVMQKQTVKAGTMTNGEFATAQMASDKEVLDWYKEQSKEDAQDRRTDKTTNATLEAARIAANGRENARSAARSDRSYQFNSAQLEKTGTPIDAMASRVGRLVDTLAQKSPQADALIAPELLTVMAGGQGSGLRMNEAEIARIIGGRSAWQSLKASINKWNTDPKAARSITPEQDAQIQKLVGAVQAKLLAKQKVISDARNALVDEDDPIAHRKIVADAHSKLDIIDAGGIKVTTPGGDFFFPTQEAADQFKKDAKLK